jgi:zinc transporter 9
MGVVIPEGIETLHHASKSSTVPTQTIALCLLSGFTLMLLIEQLLTPSSHHHQPAPPIPRLTLFDEDDIEQLELGPAPGDQYPDPALDPDPTPVPGGRMGRRSVDSSSRQSSIDVSMKRVKSVLGGEAVGSERDGNPNAITLGLVIHSLADGLALGASARSGQNALEAIVFLAIIVHKGTFPPIQFACKLNFLLFIQPPQPWHFAQLSCHISHATLSDVTSRRLRSPPRSQHS